MATTIISFHAFPLSKPKPKRPFSSIHCLRPPTTAAVETFWQWLTDQRVITEKSPAKPGLVPQGLGLIAQRDIARNEVVLEVPMRFWINPDAVIGSEIGTFCGGLKGWVSVALFFIRERMLGDGSKWRVYLDLLPQWTDSTIFWSEEELNEIQGTQLLRTTLAVKELVRGEFQKVEEVVLSHRQLFTSPVTLDDFFWAFGILRSRAFTQLSGESLVLVPLADLVEHLIPLHS